MGLTPAEVILELTGDHNAYCNLPDAPPCIRHLRLSKRTAEGYLERVKERFREAAKLHDPMLRDQILALQFRCYQGAFAKGNYGGAAMILMDIARLAGYLEPAVPQQIIQLLSAIPSDRDRFPADTNYQVSAFARDMLLASAARGSKRAAEAAALVASQMTEAYGTSRSGLANGVEEDIVARVRAHLVTEAHFPDGPLVPLERRDSEGRVLPAVDDFANLETPAKPDKSEGKG